MLPADWQQLPDGTDTANVLAGTLANHYLARQQAQAERLAAAASVEAANDTPELPDLPPDLAGTGHVPPDPDEQEVDDDG